MTDIENQLAVQKKRIIMRANHRGMKEMDLILGRFVDAKIDSMSQNACNRFEKFMEINDQLLYAAICQFDEIDSQYTDIIEEIRNFIQDK